MNRVTIKPATYEGGAACLKTNGTQVVLEDGSVLSGVTKITLTAEVNSVWTAEIECHVEPPLLEGVLAQIKVNSWETATGVESLTSESVRFAGEPE